MNEPIDLSLAASPKEVTVKLICMHCSKIICEEYTAVYREQKPTVAKGHCWKCVRVGAGTCNETIITCRVGSCGRLHHHFGVYL